jgi:formylglycine-generating enzyme required for sulfatase activity
VSGRKLLYAKRNRRRQQDWTRFPALGISADDATAYVAWLAATGRVPGARLCTDREWERAARGADARQFPQGDFLLPDDANFDRTYGREPLGYGPDEIGSHPASRSPFGVEDMCGNVSEWTRSSLEPGALALRGGSYHDDEIRCRIPNRRVPESSLRDLGIGIRVCADFPATGAPAASIAAGAVGAEAPAPARAIGVDAGAGAIAAPESSDDSFQIDAGLEDDLSTH